MPRDPKLGGFKVGDLKKPTIRSGGPIKKGAAEEPPPSASVGFPAIEKRLESSTVDAVADELRPSYEKLEAMASGGDAKAKAAAKKAMAAYERTADLFEYLFSTKAALGK